MRFRGPLWPMPKGSPSCRDCSRAGSWSECVTAGGVVVLRDENGGWRPPIFITITGGSFGWQIGVQATDIVLVFKTKTSVEHLIRGTFTIGGDVAVAAGPVGRQAEAATDARLKAEIFSYSRSRGLFAGLALDGSVIQVDTQANVVYYRSASTGQAGQPQTLPPSAARLLGEIGKLHVGGRLWDRHGRIVSG